MKNSESSEYQTDILAKLEHQGYTFNMQIIKKGLQSLIHTLMDIEVSQILDATRYERSSTRRAYRNGYRTTVWNSSIGNVQLRIPKLRRGSYYPERLLNDSDVEDSLIRLIKQAIVFGLNGISIEKSLSALELFPLTPYELNRVCDELQRELRHGGIESQTSEFESLTQKSLSLNHRKYLLLLRKQDEPERNTTITLEETRQLDKEFWRDFTRRMSQSGVILESDQLVLSDINPYARLDVAEVESAFKSNFVTHIYTLYEDQLIA